MQFSKYKFHFKSTRKCLSASQIYVCLERKQSQSVIDQKSAVRSHAVKDD